MLATKIPYPTARYDRAYATTYKRYLHVSSRFVQAAMEALTPTQSAYEDMTDAQRGQYFALKALLIERATAQAAGDGSK